MNASQSLNAVFTDRWNEHALICDSRKFTYGELYAHAASISAWITGQGCQTGDSIALKLPNGWAFAAAYLACLIGGFRVVPVNTELNAAEQEYIVARTRPQIVVDNELTLIALDALNVGVPAFNYPDDCVAAIFFTSGTTGRPKGVCHSLGALVSNVQVFNHAMGIDNKIRQYHVLPMAYMAGFLNTLLSPWLAGGLVLLGPRFRSEEVLHFWERPIKWQANSIWLTPTLAALLARMSRNAKTALQVGTSLKHVFCGTAPLSASTRKAFSDAFGCPLQESYGMSEILLVAAQTRDEAMAENGVGRLLPGIYAGNSYSLSFVADELIIYTNCALKAYLLEEEESSPLLSDGGMPTGDQGEIDENNKLRITGRLKDLIIRGGVNVSPVVIEEVVLSNPQVEEVAVVGVKHDIWGEIIAACVVATSGTETTELEAALVASCKKELGYGMRPDRFVWLESLPRASTGKIQKNILRELLA